MFFYKDTYTRKKCNGKKKHFREGADKTFQAEWFLQLK
jgi:hypothetical protein